MNVTQHNSQWRERFLESTRGRIVLLLRQDERTVNELAEHLNLTDNAIRTHLAALERDRLVERAGERRGPGKPSFTYAITSDAEQLFPKAYSLALTSLLATIEERLDSETQLELLAEAGRRLANPVSDIDDLGQRAEHAASVLTDIGGLARVERQNGGMFIRGRSCPLLETAAERPDVCRLAAALVEALIDAPVSICCQYGETPRCCFEIDMPASAG